MHGKFVVFIQTANQNAEMNKCWKIVVTPPLMSPPPFDAGLPKHGETQRDNFPRGVGGEIVSSLYSYLPTLHQNICGVLGATLLIMGDDTCEIAGVIVTTVS